MCGSPVLTKCTIFKVESCSSFNCGSRFRTRNVAGYSPRDSVLHCVSNCAPGGPLLWPSDVANEFDRSSRHGKVYDAHARVNGLYFHTTWISDTRMKLNVDNDHRGVFTRQTGSTRTRPKHVAPISIEFRGGYF